MVTIDADTMHCGVSRATDIFHKTEKTCRLVIVVKKFI